MLQLETSETDMNNTIRVVARVSVRPDKFEETLEALTQLVAATRAEPGCVSYELLRNIANPHELTFVEEWADAESLESHFATEHFSAVAARAEELLTAPPDIRRYTVLA
jgi:quinol monooxygenase YgiN